VCVVPLTILENDNLERMVFSRNVAWNWEKCYRNSEIMKVAFGEQSMSRTQVFEWFSKFESGINFGEYAECLGHPITKRDKNVDQVMERFLKNRRMTINKV
jgi:hypothetical protein